MTEHERKLIRALRILLNWGKKNDGITPPFPVYHSYMSKIDGDRLPRWRTPEVTSSTVFLQAHADGELAIIESAEALVKDDPGLDPDGHHDPHEVAVWYIRIPTWGGTQYVATEAEAEEWRRHKAKAEQSAGSTKQRHTGATPQELARYAAVGPHHLE